MKKTLMITVLVLGLLFSAIGCASGQTSAPTIEDIERDAEIIKFHTKKGYTITCLYYSKKGKGSGDEGYSWLILDCDWFGIDESFRPLY